MPTIKSFYSLSIFLLAFVCFSCKTDTTNTTKSTTSTNTPQQTSKYPPLPADRLQELGSSSIIDFLFHQIPISMNLNEPGSIQRALTHISLQAPATMNCNSPIGRIFYQKEGETLIEADIFFEKGCAYLVFIEKGKPAFANNLSPVGIQFLQGSIKQATGILIEP